MTACSAASSARTHPPACQESATAGAGADEGHAFTKTQRGLAPSASTHSTSACTSCMLTLAAGFEGCTDARACATTTAQHKASVSGGRHGCPRLLSWCEVAAPRCAPTLFTKPGRVLSSCQLGSGLVCTGASSPRLRRRVLAGWSHICVSNALRRGRTFGPYTSKKPPTAGPGLAFFGKGCRLAAARALAAACFRLFFPLLPTPFGASPSCPDCRQHPV